MNDVAPLHSHASAGRVVDPRDARWIRLRELILEHSLKLGDFILSSGRTSTYLFQLRQTTMLPEGAALTAEIILEYMRVNSIRSIGGLEMGAVPLAASVSAMSFVKNFPVAAFFVRKAPKGHGARERIDGHVRDGEEVLVVDDVATSGGSILKAAEGLHAEHPGCSIRRALAVVDREEGAAENLAKRNIELVSVFKKSDFPIEGL